MVEFIGGVLIGGVAGIALKDKVLGGGANEAKREAEMKSLYAENEKFAKRNKELERLVEDLQSELARMRRNAKDKDSINEDIEDELDRVRKDLKMSVIQRDELSRKVKELTATCASQEAEIKMYKEKIG